MTISHFYVFRFLTQSISVENSGRICFIMNEKKTTVSDYSVRYNVINRLRNPRFCLIELLIWSLPVSSEWIPATPNLGVMQLCFRRTTKNKQCTHNSRRKSCVFEVRQKTTKCCHETCIASFNLHACRKHFNYTAEQDEGRGVDQ